jgi:ATP-dependent RNA helicase DDX27
MYVKLKSPDEITREAVLIYVIKTHFKEKSIVFFKTKQQCHRMAIIFGMAGLKATELHGNLTQKQRIQSLMQFTQGDFTYLLATDLAARGLDIADIQTVINYEFPVELMRYIHRVGRTARAGKRGVSFTICNEIESKKLKKLMRKYNEKPECMKLDKVKVVKEIKGIKKMKWNISNIL